MLPRMVKTGISVLCDCDNMTICHINVYTVCKLSIAICIVRNGGVTDMADIAFT